MAFKHPQPFSKEEMPVWKIRLPFTSTGAISKSVSRQKFFNHSFKLVYCHLIATTEDDFSQKAFIHFPSALTFLFKEPTWISTVSFLPMVEIKYLIQGHSLQQGMKTQWSFVFSCPHFSGDAPGISSPPSRWGNHRPLPFFVARLGAVCPCFPGPMNLACSGYFDPWQCIFHKQQPSQQIQSSVSLPVPMRGVCVWGGGIWHLIINWITGGISGARWVLSLVTGNYLWCALKFPGANGTEPINVYTD